MMTRLLLVHFLFKQNTSKPTKSTPINDVWYENVVQAGEQGYLYASVGAAVLSVLTEPKWFKGSLADMKEVRIATNKMREGKAEKRYMPSKSILLYVVVRQHGTIYL